MATPETYPFCSENNHVYYSSISSLDTNRVWAFGGLSHIIKSIDGGTNWVTLPNTPTGNYWHGQVLNENDIVAVSDSQLVSSRDGGNTWNSRRILGTRPYKSGHFYHAEKGCVFDDRRNVACTANGGETWRLTNLSGNFWSNKLNNVLFMSENEVLLSSITGIFKSMDAGTNWHYFPFSRPFGCSKVTISPDGKLFVVGENGAIGKMENNFTITQVMKPFEPESIVSVFPNPAQDFIQLKNNETAAEKAWIIDAKGKVVTGKLDSHNLLNIQELMPGLYQAVWKTKSGRQYTRFTKW